MSLFVRRARVAKFPSHSLVDNLTPATGVILAWDSKQNENSTAFDLRV